MTQPNQRAAPQDRPLDYARQLPNAPRISKLAILALILSLLSSPCLLVSLSQWINWYIPLNLYGSLEFNVRTGALVLATLFSLAAALRIAASHGELLGKPVAWAALLISLLWWALLALTYIAIG